MTKKEALLKAAKDLFAEYGYDGTTFKKISNQANVALGLLTHHFGSKEELFVIAALDVLENLKTTLQSAVDDKKNGLERVLNYCDKFIHFAVDKNTHYELLIRCMPYKSPFDNERSIFTVIIERIHHLLAQCIEQGKKDGSIDTAMPECTAEMIFCTLVGACRAKVLRVPPAMRIEAGDVRALLRRSLSPLQPLKTLTHPETPCLTN